MHPPEINIKELKSLNQSNEVAKLILEYFAACESNDYVMTVDDLQRILNEKNIYFITRQDIIQLFKDLEKLGLGDFKVGRRTQKTRFESKNSLASIGKAVIEDNQALVDHQQKPELDKEVNQNQKNIYFRDSIGEDSLGNQNRLNELLKHSFRLRSDLIVNLELPADLTNSEAERLSNFIKILPFKG